MPRPAPLLAALLSTSALALSPLFGVHAPDAPASFACNGTSPALVFGPPPTGTRSLAVIVWDQTPRTLLGRWTVYDLPATTRQLPARLALGSGVGKQGVNEAGVHGYSAPCGTSGHHDLYVDVYALDVASLGLPDGAPLQVVHAAIKLHRLQEVKLHMGQVNP